MARPKTSQMASSTQEIACSARPRSRRMSFVAGSMASQAPSGSVAVRPSSRGASSSWMIATMIDCSTSVSPVYTSDTRPSWVYSRVTIVHRLSML